MTTRIPIGEPVLTGRELEYVTECVRTNWISSLGRFIELLERQFSEYCGQPHSLAVSNGTVGLHLALKTLGVGPGDEVIVPDVTFAASANSVIHAGAVPILVDVDPETWTLDVGKTEEAIGPKTRAIMPVHLYGHPCRMAPLIELAGKHSLFLIEDCAQAIGTRHEGRMVGSFGDAAMYSFYANKTITTGEGGIVLFRKKEHYDKAHLLRDHGMAQDRKYWHLEAGFNFRMTNLQAAIGVAQMERVEEFVSKKVRIAQIYNEEFRDNPHLQLPPSAPWATNSYWLYTLCLRDADSKKRDAIMRSLSSQGIETRPVFLPLHQMPPYRAYNSSRSYPTSERLASGGISLPSAVSLSEKDQRLVAKKLLSFLREPEAPGDR